MSEKQISELVYRLVTREGFIDTFWHELAAARRADPAASRVHRAARVPTTT